MPEGFSGFDPFTGFGGPYALQPRSAGRGLGTKPPGFHPSYSGPVGGGVNPMTFGVGIGMLSDFGSGIGGIGRDLANRQINPQKQKKQKQQGPGGVSAAYHGQQTAIRNRTLAFLNAHVPGHQPYEATGAEASPFEPDEEDEQPSMVGPPTTPILKSRSQMFHPVSPQSAAVKSHIKYQQTRHT